MPVKPAPATTNVSISARRARIRLRRCPAVEVLEVPAKPHGILEGPEREGMLLDAGDAVVLGLAAGPDDQVVVGIARPVRDHLPLFEVDGADPVSDEIHVPCAEDLAEADLHGFGLDPAAGDLVELRHQGVVGVPVDEGDLDVPALPEPALENLGSFHAAVPAAEHGDANRVWHTSPLRNSSILSPRWELSTGGTPEDPAASAHGARRRGIKAA